MPNVGPMELIVVLVIALLILGPKKLPEAGRGLGAAIRGFKESLTTAAPRAEDVAPTAEERLDPPVAD